jgi:mannose-6-phosphate isomerase-like protein (cupin superfamily)
MSDEYSMVRVADVEREPSAVSGTMHADLFEALGCTEMRPKVWYLSEGDSMGYHRQAEQEEFYYVLSGPGRIRIDDEYVDVPEGSALRIPPETPRQILNDGEGGVGEHVWLVVGAPNVPDDGLPAGDE